MIDDFDLIVSSFRSEYGVSLRSKEFQTMKWTEFVVLLTGLSENSPLARTAAIRLENDPDRLKYFNSAQLRIRQEWRDKQAKPVEQADIENIKQMFMNMS